MNHRKRTDRTLELTLREYLPRGKHKRVLDAMCGSWYYGKTLFKCLKEHSCKELIGVEKEKLPFFSFLLSEGMSYKNLSVETMPREYDDYFNAITNFRPNVLKDSLINAYQRINQMLKKNGFFLATTYTKEEMNKLVELLEASDFKIKKAKPNKKDEFGLYHGYLVIAKPL